MKNNIYLQALLLFGALIIYEALAFLYKDGFTISDMNWIGIVVFTAIYLIYNIYKKNKA
ncbi:MULTISPECIES: hypothetical protein [unclassified Maribacter]|uniref:hypothetical protein n=1 Tax=unclassified Maribacter TaxID=2615042 RepID=UPI0025811D3F|nr:MULTISPECIES: hypothetical protein [unclassified Maribacter]|tara:strand:- start:237 stop:413 length:177 start_codon:yes stop_codon:yes gene_type:complete